MHLTLLTIPDNADNHGIQGGIRMKKKSGIVLKLALIVALAVIALASCDINAPAGTVVDLNSSEKSLSADASGFSKGTPDKTPVVEKIVGTAAIAPDCFFFEFDMVGQQKFARALVPVSPDGYIKNGKLLYNTKRYKIASFVYDQASGYLQGTTAQEGGVSYAFAGLYSQDSGFFGTISKFEQGVEKSGYFIGSPMLGGKNIANYIGVATYLFPTPTPQTLVFNTILDFDAGTAVGTWSESGEGWNYSLHGPIAGTVEGDSVNFNASVLPIFRPYMLYDMTAVGSGTFKNKGKKTVSGDFTIYYGDLVLPSLLTATKEMP
jgi:hypothetical protein